MGNSSAVEITKFTVRASVKIDAHTTMALIQRTAPEYITENKFVVGEQHFLFLEASHH